MTDQNVVKQKLPARCKLSDTFLDKQQAAPPGKRITIWDTTPGFGCRITDKGTISFFVMRRRAGERHGKPIRIVLGPYGRMSVQTAREKAKEQIGELVAGIDPRERQRQQREAKEAERATTFRAVADEYHKRHLQHLDRGLEVWRYIDKELLWPRIKRDSWRDRPIATITTDEVLGRLDAFRHRGKTESARRMFEITRALFVWAKMQRCYKLRILPTDDIRPTAILGKKNRRKHILSDEYLRALWRAAGKFGYPAGHFVKLLLLTALRRGEVARARWDEFSLNGSDEDSWTIPAIRMKNDAPHNVPITSDIAALLRPNVDEDDDGIPRFAGGQFVFSYSGGKKCINGFTVLKKTLDRMMLRELRAMARARGEDSANIVLTPWRIHDIRRTVRTHLSAIQVPGGDIVRELILAHRRPELHDIYDQHAYFREKKFALEEWAKRLKGIVEPLPAADNVLMLRAKA